MSEKIPELIFEQSPKLQIPKRGQESVWDYPLQPKLESLQCHITVEFGGLVMAESCAHPYVT